MTAIIELKEWLEKQIEYLERMEENHDATTVKVVKSKLQELCKKDRTFLEKSFTKNLNNYGCEDSVNYLFVINYKKDLEEVVKGDE